MRLFKIKTLISYRLSAILKRHSADRSSAKVAVRTMYPQLIDFVSAFVMAGVFFICSFLIYRKKLIKPYIPMFLLFYGLSFLVNLASPIFKEPLAVASHYSLGFLALIFLVKHIAGSMENGSTKFGLVSFMTIYAVVLAFAVFLPEATSGSHLVATWYLAIATGFLVCFYFTISWFFFKYWRSRQTLLNIQVIAARKTEIGAYVAGLLGIPIIMLLDLNAEWLVPEWVLHTILFALVMAVVGPGYLFAARRKSFDPFFSLFSNTEQLDLLRTALQQSSEGIVIANMSGRIMFVNTSWAKMHGYEKSELMDKNLNIVLNAKQIEEFKVIEKSLLSRGSWNGEINHLRKDDSVFPTLTTLNPLRDAGERCVGTLSISRDITERKRMENVLRESEEKHRDVSKKLEALLETAMEGITVVDPDENLIFANEAFANLLGYTKNELIGMNLRKLVDKKEYEKIQEETKNRKRGKSNRYEAVLYRKDGKPCSVLVSVSPLWNNDGSFAGSLAVCVDITERKEQKIKLGSLKRNIGTWLRTLKTQ